MSFNATVIWLEVEAVLATAGASERLVFGAAAEAIVATLESGPPAGLLCQMYVLATILGIEFLVMLASVGVRCWLGSKSCWLFRLQTSSLGCYLMPNFSFCWQVPVLLFLGGLQVNVWLLWAFMNDQWLHGFYFWQVIVWLGFVMAALVATWSLACARGLEIARTGYDSPAPRRRTVPFVYSPAFLNAFFPGLIAFIVALACIWGGLANTAYQRMVDDFHGPLVVELAADAAAAAAMTAGEFAAARARALAALQVAFDKYRRLVWLFQAAYISAAAHDLFAWILALVITIPSLTRLYRRLYHPNPDLKVSLAPSAQSDLRLAFLTACATVLVLSIACVAYALLVIVRSSFYGGFTTFRNEAYISGVAAIWVFAGLAVFACPVALAHSVMLLRAERGDPKGRVGRVAGLLTSGDVAEVLGGSTAIGPGSGRGHDGRSVGMGRGRGRDRGRFVVTVEHEVDPADVEGIELGLELGLKRAETGPVAGSVANRSSSSTEA